VFVWLVFDSCHSATGARAIQIPGIRVRAVAPESLGEPRRAISLAGTPAMPNQQVVRLDRHDLPGGYVAFYAAQTDGLAPELPLPAGEPDRRVHGLFTFALLRSLANAGSDSYREVAHRILAFYSTTYPATTPEFEGALDIPIGAPASPLVSPGAWPARNTGDEFHIEAGTLNGVTVGSLLALENALPARRQSLAIGLLRVNRSLLTESWAKPLTDPADLARWHVAKDLTEETGAGLVRPLETRQDVAVRIAGPASCFPGLLACSAPAQRAQASPDTSKASVLLRQRGVLPGGAALTNDLADADLLLVVTQQRLLVVRAGIPETDLTRSVGVDLNTPDAQTKLQEVLLRAVRAVGLVRLGAQFPGSAHGLTAAMRVRDGSGRWHSADSRHLERVPLAAQLAIRLQNAGPLDLDVTVLAIDERFAITTVYPLDQESNLLRRNGAPVEVPGWATAPGRYELLFITEEARAGHPHDLSYLAQPGQTRGGASSGFAMLLGQLGFQKQITRSAAEPEGEAAIQVIRYEVADGP
jgi:hypothetical protein